MSTANAKHAGNRRKLTRAEKKEIAALIRAAKGDGKAHTAQQTIPYLAMYPDGICKVTEKKYSKSIAYDDINYQLAQADDKTAIFENWCDFLNYFDATVSVQLSFINRGTRSGGAKEVVAIPVQNDAFNSIRTEYADMLKHQLAKGNNGFVKSKYITFSVEADNLNAAKARLARIETDILNNFKVLGAAARPMTGYERLEALHSAFHPEGEPFRFSWDWLTPSGLTTKDFIAPSSFRFGEGRYFRMGRKIGAVSFLEILAPELNDRMLADILDLETGIVVNLHIKSIDQTEAIKTIKRKITDLDKMKIEEQKKAVRSGYDMDIIPSDLAMFGGEAKNLLQDLQSRNERMFLLTFLVVNMADTKRKLENDIFAAAGIAQKYNCALTRLDYQQEAGLLSSVPIGENLIPIQRGLTTSSTAIFIPFITQELFQTGAALYYGLNALSNNMILCDRKRLKNPNGLILGTPGSGKSFAAKREITNAFLITDDDIIICDPEAEYYPLVRRLHGQVIRISPTSTQYVNPMDINLNYSEDDNPLALKSDFLLSLCELVIGGKEGLMPVEKTVIDRSVRNVYRPFLAAPDPAKMPILGDLYDELLRQPEPEAARVAAALELYVSGSLNVFNHRTKEAALASLMEREAKDNGYASGNRQYLADTVALPGQGGTLDADKYYPGMSVWDSSLGKPKWWTGSGWWQPVAAPITPADTSFVQAAEGEYQQQPNFTNALNTADPDFKPNTRLNGSGGESTDVRTYTMWTSNYIGCKSGDVIRVRCPDGTFESGGSIWPIAVQYNGMKTSTGAVTYKATSGTSYDAVFDSDGKGFSITINDLSVAFIRIVGNGDAAGAIITKNQEIAYKQVWVGTPMQFGDEVKQNMANVFVQAPNDTLYTIAVDNSGNLSAKAFTQ